MGMRSSDVSFLRREILPILTQVAPISPEAKDALDRLSDRLANEVERQQIGWSLNRWYKIEVEMADEAETIWFVTLEVDGHEVPYVTGRYYDGGERDGIVDLTLDRRYGLTTTVDDLGDWIWFMANAMAVSAGRTSHGENSYIRNPHGRSGGGDPPSSRSMPIFMSTSGTSNSSATIASSAWSVTKTSSGPNDGSCAHNRGSVTCDCQSHPCSHC